MSPNGLVTGAASIPDDALPAEIAEYEKFAWDQVAQFIARPLLKDVWHYTTAEGLMGILSGGKIFSTQVSCLNDSRERMYFGDLVVEALKERIKTSTNPNLKPLHDAALEVMADRDTYNVGYFVACFSECDDDLSQWRGYGSGEAGYSIGFKPDDLNKVLSQRQLWIIPMNYDATTHKKLAQLVIERGEQFYLQGLARGRKKPDAWARYFVYRFSLASERFACAIKHPKFSGEREWRIGYYLGEGDHSSMIFRAKRTLLARHIPLDLTPKAPPNHRIPTSRIFVGPGAGQKASRIAVGDLLKQKGYEGVAVELSEVPYRTV